MADTKRLVILSIISLMFLSQFLLLCSGSFHVTACLASSFLLSLVL
ncbi:unnamed protein product [Brassica rapa subsp. trilocularis]|uniref:(rape) hypothetical protein n=1 Tax=Brassica napus TaxID=3708 RepID=A0A078IQ83_BRANA|nr:unnamed protein product [Brassica napus]CDY51273.1 BnaA10g11750D [Brassica napus]